MASILDSVSVAGAAVTVIGIGVTQPIHRVLPHAHSNQWGG